MVRKHNEWWMCLVNESHHRKVAWLVQANRKPVLTQTFTFTTVVNGKATQNAQPVILSDRWDTTAEHVGFHSCLPKSEIWSCRRHGLWCRHVNIDQKILCQCWQVLCLKGIFKMYLLESMPQIIEQLNMTCLITGALAFKCFGYWSIVVFMLHFWCLFTYIFIMPVKSQQKVLLYIVSC